MRAHVLLEEYLEYVTDVLNYAPSTVRSYQYFLRLYVEHLGDNDLQELGLKDVDDYFAVRKRMGFKPTTLNWERCIIRSFFMYVDRYRGFRLKFDYSMIRRIKAEKPRVKFATVDKVQQMMDALSNAQDKLIIATMFYTGMRIGEIVDFTLEDFNDTEIIIRGKGGKKRVLPLHDDLSQALDEHIRINNIRTGPIFRHQINSGKHSGKFTVSGLRKRFQRQLGPLYINPHALRHGNATALLRGGMNLRELQVFLGHEHISSTQVYTHVTNSDLGRSYREHFPQTALLNK